MRGSRSQSVNISLVLRVSVSLVTGVKSGLPHHTLVEVDVKRKVVAVMMYVPNSYTESRFLHTTQSQSLSAHRHGICTNHRQRRVCECCL